MNINDPKPDRGYIPLGDHGLIGNLRTAALVSIDGSIESYCIPNFDSPSIFARILDKDKGGHFSISPTVPFTTKQNYLPSSNVLQTKFLNDQGVATITDFLPRQPKSSTARPLLAWLIRRVEVIRGSFPLRVECAPAFDYARAPHTTKIIPDTSVPSTFIKPKIAHHKVLFTSPKAGLSLDLRYIAEATLETVSVPAVDLQILDLTGKGHLGLSACCDFTLSEGQAVTFVLRIPPEKEARDMSKLTPEKAQEMCVPYEQLLLGASDLRPPEDPFLTKELLRELLEGTTQYWNGWIRRSTYDGSWKEAVNRSALALKLLIYEPTGAVVASPTFSLPEYIGGTRNWDYRASWIRDSSFILYALIRLGFTHEANAYMEFILERLRTRNPDGSLNIMYTIHGEKLFPEEVLSHLEGHKGSRPVRIGNGAIDHVQLDIYGELMDCIYLSQKYGKPLSYDTWVAVREIVEFVIDHLNEPDLSIWEVRDRHRNFTYSKVMLWVAIDRGLRLADKRSLPCPRRNEWIAARDALYEEIMAKAWNPKMRFFAQSYEDLDVLDSSLLIMPLVFFMTPSDPRFLSTLRQISNTPERGGLTSNGLVYRYDVKKAEDGVGGEEGTFCLCTLWCVEALARAGEYDVTMLRKAVGMFEDFLQYTNHVGLCTEEISAAGEALGNAVQGFTHVTLISAAYNLSRMQAKFKVT
ncbi:glycoside hydrolase family 15 protein [Laetiporus sulphureus 93-53]|uniref:Glycoside hydrolase family 15 protein n=1 Tax=Laetiporus sulphureus 93-53 TaxID=1314785 RepID=A0A165HXB4_9APHY|nr:glycoside hydrolase family 15 protein [Laetiporus sulphureus 93-53]KZT12312.1 glycoside hydrolase family 15 protein [Laetiporus sulphureus 93-53]